MDKSKSSIVLSKRQFLGVVAAATAVSVSPSLLAANKTAHHHASYSKSLVKVSEECVSVGQACKAHIYETLKSDDLSLTQCLLEVRNTIATCTALVEMLTNGSAHSPAYRSTDGAAYCSAVSPALDLRLQRRWNLGYRHLPGEFKFMGSQRPYPGLLRRR